jgi:hypothetical protein
MKTLLACPECAQGTHGVVNFFAETIRQDGVYTGKCPNGHDLLIATQTLPHEMLFEIALNAIGDGYYREAVSSFAASVELFMNFRSASLQGTKRLCRVRLMPHGSTSPLNQNASSELMFFYML